jgi:hypothetical protein
VKFCFPCDLKGCSKLNEERMKGMTDEINGMMEEESGG